MRTKMFYSTFTIIILVVFLQGLDALQFSSVAMIYPQRPDQTVDVGSDLTLGCRGAEPMRWVFNDDYNGQYFSTAKKNIIHRNNTKEMEYKYETILTVYNMSHVNIGFYYCHGAEVDFDTPRRSSRIYIFVHDTTHLSVITSTQYTFVDGLWLVFVPCRPNAQDINITVTCESGFIYQPYLAEMSVNPRNYTAIQQGKDYMGKFNPYHGFTFTYQTAIPLIYSCSCVYTRNNQTHNLELSRTFEDGYTKYDAVSIAGPDTETANVGGDITLQCVYMELRYFPYNKYWPNWEFPTSGRKQTEILQVIKLKIYILVINSITMNNISKKDEGYYKCYMDSRVKSRQVGTASKYVYVNEKKSNDSAPRIYFPTGGEIQINSGENITLCCEGSRPVTWSHQQGRKFHSIKHIANRTGRYETYLHLTKASYADVGLYQCHENDSTPNHPFQSDKIYIFVKDAQFLYVPPPDTKYYVMLYSNVTVPCLPTSRDVRVTLSIEPKQRWDLDPMIDPVIHSYDPREGYTIHMTLPDGLIAKCSFVSNTTKYTQDIEYITFDYGYSYVQSEPLITGPHEDLVFFGQTLELSCIVFVRYTTPDNMLSWTTPNQVTSNETIIERERINLVQGKVLISKLRLYNAKDANEGRYFCHSKFNNANMSKFISVYDQFAVNKPSIEYLQYNYAYIGQPLVLRCKVNVNHNIVFRMSWTLPNDREIKIQNIQYIPTIRNTTGEIILKIDNTTYKTEGNYSCNVFYSVNSKNYTTKHILVKKGTKPRIVTSNLKNQEQIIVQVGERVNLECFAQGDPKPVITWTKDDSELRTLGKHIVFTANDSKLTVNYVQGLDAGQYTCIAQNPFGRDFCAVNLRLKTVSSIPYIAAIIFLVIVTAVASVLQARKSYKQKKLRKKLNEAGFIKFKSGEIEGLNSLLNISEQATLLPYDTKWEIPRNNIELGRNLGSGYFGLVVEATVSNYFDGEPEKTVAVKMLHRNCGIIELNSLICELKIMTHLGEHINLINLLGACTERIAEGNLLVVIEYCKHGSLRNYLINNRCNFVNLIDPDTELICLPDDFSQDGEASGDTTRTGEVSTLQLLRWALQVAHGMEFLASKQILHGDLAVRNILLDENYVVKISDFGLSKTLSSSGYYKKQSQCPLPIKWMAIESIRSKTFSTQSDVWAFGVVLWELFSLARTPYAELEPDLRFYRKLESGYRLQRPDFSTKEIYQVMRECWYEEPQSRPTFSCIARTLADLLQDPYKFQRCSIEESASDECVSYCAHGAAASGLVAGQENTAARDWIVLDILPSSSSAQDE